MLFIGAMPKPPMSLKASTAPQAPIYPFSSDESTIMKRTNLVKALPLIAFGLLACPVAYAHEGHGLPGFAHWHSTDVVGFVGAACVAMAVGLWMKGHK